MFNHRNVEHFGRVASASFGQTALESENLRCFA